MPIDYTDSSDRMEAPGEYWAAVPKDRIAPFVTTRVRDNYAALDEGGFIDLYKLSHATYYGLDGSGNHSTSRVIEFGEQGEKLGVKSNQLRSLAKYIHLTATQNTPSIKPRAINSTPKALAQIPAARRILEYYDRKTNTQDVYASAALRCLLYGKGYVVQAWDPFAGPPPAAPAPEQEVAEPPHAAPEPPEGTPADAAEDSLEPPEPAPEAPTAPVTGDLMVRAGGPLDVTVDLDVDNNQHDWCIMRIGRNRFDQVAMYTALSPQAARDPKASMDAASLREALLAAPRDVLNDKLSAKLQFWNRRRKSSQSDRVFEYHFMHRKTPALPQGRYVIVTGDDIVLFDGPLPYDEVPVDVMCAEEFLEMGDVGYSSIWDLLGLQNIYDAAFSICATNMDAFGQNDILIPEGVEIGIEEIRDGLNVIRYPMGDANKPEMLEKFAIKKEFFELMDRAKGDMETTVGVNSVARGEPQASLESGAALALVQAQAVTFQGPYVKAYSNLVARASSTRIKILQRHLPKERIIAIAGSDDPDSIREFSTPEIDLIDRIEVEGVSPLFSTSAGKQNAADKMLERGLIASPHAYVQFTETGRLETVTDDTRRKDLFGRRVREALMSGPEIGTQPGQPDPMTGMPGQPQTFVPTCRYVITDDPRVCLAAASSVLDSFDMRQDQRILQACTAYMGEVLRIWRGTDPDTLTLLGYPVPQAAIARAQGVPLDPKAVGGGGAPPPKGTAPAQKPADKQAPAEGSSMPSLPKPAENPL